MFYEAPSMTGQAQSPSRTCPSGKEPGYAVSCWRLSWLDRLRLLLGGKVWVHVIGREHPPIAIETEHPFKGDAP